MTRIIEFSGTVLTAPGTEQHGLWSVDGVLTFRRPAAAPDLVLDGWVIPGLVDAHCHIGLRPGGDVPEKLAEQQAVTDRDAGTLLVRDAGAVHDTRWIQQRADLPRLVLAGRHIARTRRYLRGFAVEVEPEDLVEAVRKQARAGDGWVKLVGDWIDRGRRRSRGELSGTDAEGRRRCRPRRRRPRHGTLLRRRHPGRHARRRDRLHRARDRGCSRGTFRGSSNRACRSSTLINIATFPDIAAEGRGQVPALRGAHALALGAPGRTRP